MPLKRTYKKRNPVMRRKRKYVAKKVPRALISTANKGVAFKRTFFKGNWAFGTTTTADFWRHLHPRFSDLPNYTEYTNLFDEFRMTGIKITFHPRISSVDSAGNINTAIVQNQMYITIANATQEYEYVPSGTYSSSTYNSFLEELGSNTKTYKFDKPVGIYFKPKIVEDIGSVGNLGKKHSRCPWLQLSNSILPQMHGMHAFIHDYNFTNLNPTGFGCDVQYTFYFQCRGQA